MKPNTTLILHHILWRGLYFLSVLGLNILIARFFAAERSGQIFYVVNNLAIILLIVSVSLESGMGYYLASENISSSQVAHFSLVWALAASVIAIATWSAILHFSHSAYLSQPGFISVSYLFIIGILFTSYFTALFYAKKEFVLPNKILFFINAALILVLIFFRNDALVRNHFIQFYFLSFFLQGVLLRIFFLKKESDQERPFLPKRSLRKKIIRYSLAALIANMIYFLVNRVDYWFVQYYCSANDLGNYIQASKLGQMLLVLPSILGSTLFPIFSSNKNTDSTAEMASVVRVLLWINLGICLFIILTGWFLFPMVFGTSFPNMYLLFVLLIPGILSFAMNYPIASWFSATRRIGVNIRGGIMAFAIILLGDLFLIPRYGVFTAPLISSAGYFSFYCYSVYMFRKEYFIPLKDFLLIRKTDLVLVRASFSKISNPIPKTPFSNPTP